MKSPDELNREIEVMRDSAFMVTNGQVTRARRLNRPINLLWGLTVQPSSAGDITINLPENRACGTAGAICTADGRWLSSSPTATVR